MRDSHLTEIFALVLAGIGGMLLYIYTWVSVIVGLILIFFDFYFVMTNLKRQTIQEYRDVEQDGGEKHGN